MRQRSPFLLFLGLLLLSGCTDYEKLARDDLAAQHLTDVKLTPTGRGKFDFVGSRSGAPCRGSIGIKKGFGKSTTDRTLHCEPICSATTPEVCLDEGLALAKSGDLPKARATYEKGCDFKDGGSCTNLGVIFDHGNGVPMDRTKALALFDKACELKSGVGCKNAGIGYDALKPPKHDISFKRYQQSCTLREDEGCLNADRAYLLGQGVAANKQAGFTGLDGLCDKGFLDGCDALGVALIQTPVEAWDTKRGAIVLQEACDKGSFVSCADLGILLRDGPLPKDLKRAAALFEKACTGKNGAACNELGVAILSGDAARDEGRAVQLYKHGCELENAMACWNYGRHLRSGEGVEKDLAAAHRTFVKSCGLGNEKACQDKDAG